MTHSALTRMCRDPASRIPAGTGSWTAAYTRHTMGGVVCTDAPVPYYVERAVLAASMRDAWPVCFCLNGPQRSKERKQR